MKSIESRTANMSTPIFCGPVNRVVVVGGTHGNEMSGVCLAKHWLQDSSDLCRETFTAEPLLANPLAVERCVRYIDTDLNRCFSSELLSGPDSEKDPYEVKLAREIFQKYGSKQSSCDFVFDLHNTTSNMGATLMLSTVDNPLEMHMANYLQSNCVDDSIPCHVFVCKLPGKDTPYLPSIGKHCLGLELGPQAHGIIRADTLRRMRELVNCSLNFLDLYNQGKEFPSFEIDVCRVKFYVDYPRGSDGELQGFIHTQLQDKDYHPLQPGCPIFQTLHGEELCYDGEKTIYPTFVNEGAYYEKNVAFIAMEKLHCTVPALKVQR
ncbi:N-acyl-aromatic-L-amino acid amidohydrolase (carboxylate-forming)-like isoform X1 [Ascaphus truei]|uniref:N-acyl-aromatic-L-amino acid amidohydrolase (carboxylate-forming)-like isoform X1 n=2 Tax=Ascaphus truei TaxID=8439 RepID=UPI003F5A843B